MKKIGIIICSLIIIGCNGENDSQNKNTISLTNKEVKSIGNNKSQAAQLLIKKAILKEKEKANFTEDEEKKIKNLKDNLEVEFFIEREAVKDITVDPVEIVQVYNQNKKSFGDRKLEAVAPQIKQLIIEEKIKINKTKYLNKIIEKYKLNDKLKEYFKKDIPNKMADIEKKKEKK